MAHHLVLSAVDAQGKLRSLPIDDAIDPRVLSSETLWLDIAIPDGTRDPEPELEAALERVGVPDWIDTDRLLHHSSSGRRPAKIRVTDGWFIARFYWVEPEELSLDAFMDQVLTDATRRGAERPRREEIRSLCGEGLLVTCRSVDTVEESRDTHEQISTILTDGPIASNGRVAVAAAMLARFLDAVLEDELDAIEGYDELADELQDRVLDTPDPSGRPTAKPSPTSAPRAYTGEEIQKGLAVMRREVGLLRRLLIPYGELRELTQNPIPCVQPLLNEFIDLREGVLRVVGWIDTVRDLLTSTYEALLARQSNQMNLIMKKLTAWAAILLVPTLITGVYGMNFEYMPELRLAHGYYGAVGIIIGSMVLLYVVFRRKRWL